MDSPQVGSLGLRKGTKTFQHVGDTAETDSHLPRVLRDAGIVRGQPFTVQQGLTVGLLRLLQARRIVQSNCVLVPGRPERGSGVWFRWMLLDESTENFLSFAERSFGLRRIAELVIDLADPAES